MTDMWYLVYTNAPHYDHVSERLTALGIRHFIPVQYEWERARDPQSRLCPSHPYSNLLFVHTDDDIIELVRATDCLAGLYHHRVRGGAAAIADEDMETYHPLLTHPDREILYLDTPYDDLHRYPEVYVSEGPFADWRGRVLRVNRGSYKERRLMINLASLSVVVEGIPYAAFRRVDNDEPLSKFDGSHPADTESTDPIVDEDQRLWLAIYSNGRVGPSLGTSLSRIGVEYYMPIVAVRENDLSLNVDVEEALYHIVMVAMTPTVEERLQSDPATKELYQACRRSRFSIISNLGLELFKQYLVSSPQKLRLLPGKYSDYDDHPTKAISHGPFSGIKGRAVLLKSRRLFVLDIASLPIGIMGL